MSKRLGEDDKRAVDLLLDKTATAGKTTMYAAPGNDGPNPRVHSVSTLLKLLDEMPAMDPPADLTLRTLQRIEGRDYAVPPPPAQGTGAPVHSSAHMDPRKPG